MALNPRPARKTFKPSPYNTQRHSRGLPRWFILLVLGILMGAGGVLLLQASYGPKRLTVLESEKLMADLTTLNSKHQTAQNDLASLTAQLQSVQQASDQVVRQTQQELETLKQKLVPTEQALEIFKKALASSMSFDPIGIAGDSFIQSKSQPSLTYQVLLIQSPKSTTPFVGQADITFEGTYPNGRAGAIKTPLTSLDVASHQLVSGAMELPAGFVATRGTIRVYKSDSNRALGWRTFSVQRGN